MLVVYATGRLLPAVVEFDRGFRGELTGKGRHVEIYDEFLDASRFSGDAYEAAVARHLRSKYARLTPDVMVVAGREALQFACRQQGVFAGSTPVVHAVVTTDDLQAIGPLPPSYVGVPTRDEFARTIEQALRWHPQARHLVVVLGNWSERDRVWQARVAAERKALESRVTVDLIEGLPTEQAAARLAELGPDAVVFSPGYEIDSAGRTDTPYARVKAMAARTRAPFYGPVSTFIGIGVIGGYMADFETQGRQAAYAVTRLLDGMPPTALRLPASVPTALHVDWAQLRRFGIDPRTLPPGTVVHNREPSLWQEYRNELLLLGAVLLLQAGLIAGLLVERRRRHDAEVTVASSRAELAHASRLAVAGELAAAVAHEINQPLGAILSNADAAEMILESGAERHDLLRTILADIRRDDVRASEVIRRLRTLLQKNQVEAGPFSLDEAVTEVERVLRPEARRRGVTLTVQLANAPTELMGDRIQVQQVLINLVLNAMDAVADVAPAQRQVSLVVQETADRCTVKVSDRGHGIAAADVRRVFDSFFTTKRSGMGLGLSIARTIVEAHGGSIGVEEASSPGAVFVVSLPKPPARQPAAEPA